MKRKQFSEEQIIKVRQSGEAEPGKEVCRRHGISEHVLSVEVQVRRNNRKVRGL